MSAIVRRLTRAQRRQVMRRTCSLTVLSVLLSVLLTAAILGFFGIPLVLPALVSSAGAPIVLAGPLIYAMSRQMALLSEANRRLATLAATDHQTGCLNRGAFITRVEALMSSRAPETGRGKGALLVIDVDHFKRINDSHGHDAGDDALLLIVDAIRSSVRDSDAVGRIGGEEFGVFLPDAGVNEARLLAERIRRAIMISRFTPAGERHPLSASIGGAVFTGPMEYRELYRLADRRLYAAKRSGRNAIEVSEVSQADASEHSARPSTDEKDAA
ncbi:MAG TPA: GGDEF domain-containing protein [Devosiaceae bacterium]